MIEQTAHKILVVDDQPENLEVLVEVVEMTNPNYEVLQALNSKTALIIARGEIPDLIITDWEMPEMDGIELIKALKADELTKDIPIIMCTGIMTSSENLSTALKAGAVDYIRKPVDPLELPARLRSMLQLSDSFKTIKREREKSEQLLLNILPAETAQELKEFGKATPKNYEQVSVLFTDFKGFTKRAINMTPAELIEELNECFSAFDDITTRHNLEKIKTIGDAFMCAGGLPIPNTTNSVDAVSAGLEMLEWIETWNTQRATEGKEPWGIRVGVHTGALVAGVIGKQKFQYDVWGDAVNVASRMESNSEVGRLNISADTFELVKHQFECEFRGEIEAKNRGKIGMYFAERKG